MKKKRFKFSYIVIIAILFVTALGVFNKCYALENEKIVLKSFDITTKEIKRGEKLCYNIDYESNGEKVSFIGLWAKEKDSGKVFYTSTSQLSNGYFDLSQKNGTGSPEYGTFVVTGLTFGLEEGIYYFNSNCSDDTCGKYDFGSLSFTIKEKEEESGIYNYVLTGKTKSASVGEKVYISLGSPSSFNGQKIEAKELSSVLLSYTNSVDKTIMNVYVKSLGENPYFIVPSTATNGQYYLEYGYLTYVDGTTEICKDSPKKVFSYESSFSVVEKKIDTSKYIFNNDEYNEIIKSDLQKLDNDAVITINANSLPIIDKEIFELIEKTKRTLFIEYKDSVWVFNGNDIVNAKTIEVSVSIEDLLNNSNSDDFLKNKITSKSAIIKFSNNGDLPGRALIKLNAKAVEKYIDSELLYVYYYDEANGQLSKVAMEVQKNDGFYAFYINHNSKYVITSEKITEEEVSNDTKYLDLNDETSVTDGGFIKENMVYIIGGACIILVGLTLGIVLYLKKRKNKDINL